MIRIPATMHFFRKWQVDKTNTTKTMCVYIFSAGSDSEREALNIFVLLTHDHEIINKSCPYDSAQDYYMY